MQKEVNKEVEQYIARSRQERHGFSVYLGEAGDSASQEEALEALTRLGPIPALVEE